MHRVSARGLLFSMPTPQKRHEAEPAHGRSRRRIRRRAGTIGRHARHRRRPSAALEIRVAHRCAADGWSPRSCEVVPMRDGSGRRRHRWPVEPPVSLAVVAAGSPSRTRSLATAAAQNPAGHRRVVRCRLNAKLRCHVDVLGRADPGQREQAQTPKAPGVSGLGGGTAPGCCLLRVEGRRHGRRN